MFNLTNNMAPQVGLYLGNQQPYFALYPQHRAVSRHPQSFQHSQYPGEHNTQQFGPRLNTQLSSPPRFQQSFPQQTPVFQQSGPAPSGFQQGPTTQQASGIPQSQQVYAVAQVQPAPRAYSNNQQLSGLSIEQQTPVVPARFQQQPIPHSHGQQISGINHSQQGPNQLFIQPAPSADPRLQQVTGAPPSYQEVFALPLRPSPSPAPTLQRESSSFPNNPQASPILQVRGFTPIQVAPRLQQVRSAFPNNLQASAAPPIQQVPGFIPIQPASRIQQETAIDTSVSTSELINDNNLVTEMVRQQFAGLVIAVSGTFVGHTHSTIKDKIERLGATFKRHVAPDCTHLITTDDNVSRKAPQYMRACDMYNCEIVRIDWLLKSEMDGFPAAEEPYSLGLGRSANGGGQIDNDTDIKNRKRTLEEALGISEANGVVDVRKRPPNVTTQPSRRYSKRIRADKNFNQGDSFSVYVDSNGVIWDATLTRTVAGRKRNHYYRMQILIDNTGTKYRLWASWGRVGGKACTRDQADITQDVAIYMFEEKFLSKSGLFWHQRHDPPKKLKFKYIERSYEDEESDGEAESDTDLIQSVQNLIAFILNTQNLVAAAKSLPYDNRKLPLGKLSMKTLQDGYLVLRSLSELISDPSLATTRYSSSFENVAEDLSSKYFGTIPHILGPSETPVLRTKQHIRKELKFLDDLANMSIANKILESGQMNPNHPLHRQIQGLGLEELTRVYRKSTEFKELKAYFKQPTGAQNYKIIDIFRIRRNGETERFKSSPFSKMKAGTSNRRLLWHGSYSTNFAGILSQGLRITPPGVATHGSSLGKGVYFADASVKSLHFCGTRGAGDKALLLLCDVELGYPMYDAYSKAGATTNSHVRTQGLLSTYCAGQSSVTTWKDAGSIHRDLKGVMLPTGIVQSTAAYWPYSEYAVYQTAQIQLKYLFFLKLKN